MVSSQNARPAAPGYVPREEMLNALTHALGLILSLVGMYFLLQTASHRLATIALGVYGASLVLMFLASTLYHSIANVALKHWLKLVDHSAIYLLIAGTYTPFLLLNIAGQIGWIANAVIWGIALFGIVFKCFAHHRFPKISVFTYLLMGWLAVLLIYPLYQALPANSLVLLVVGGLFFSVGVAFYVRKDRVYTHAIWHVFVMAGCACHYFSILGAANAIS